MKFCLRIDDYGFTPMASDSSGPLKTADRGLMIAQRCHAALRGIPYLAAVIPSCLDQDGLAWLQAQPEGMTLALHGFSHEPFEFHGLTLHKCRERIGRGMAALKGIPVAHMVLPFNRYEPELAEACYLEGIRHIWGGGSHDESTPSAWPTPPQPYPLGRLTFVPSWKPLYAATIWRMGPEGEPLQDILPRMLDLPDHVKALITLHVTWEAAKCEDFRGVRWLADTIGDRVIGPDQYFEPMQ